MSFNQFSGESVGSGLSAISDVRVDPYSFGVPNLPSPGSIASFPIKASLYVNGLRSGWAGTKYIAGLPNKFTEKSLRNQYRMTTIDGFIGQTLNDIKFTGKRFLDGDTWSGRPNRKVTPWGIVASGKGENEFAKLAGTWNAGFLDRFMVGKSGINGALNTLKDSGVISAEQLKSFIDDNKFVDQVIKNKYLVHDDYKILKSKYRLPKTPGAKHQAYSFEYDSIIKGPNQFTPPKSFSKIMREDVVSLRQLLNGEMPIKGAGYFANTIAPKRIMNIKLTMPWNRKQYARTYNSTYEAFMKSLYDNQIAVAGKEAQMAAHAAGMASVNRTKLMKMLRLPLGIAYGVPMLADMAVGGFKLINETMERSASTIRGLTKMDFGSDNLMQSSRMASERQRAVSAIQNSQMNARFLLGNEASLYH